MRDRPEGVSKTAIIGVGNILMGDEGIGVRAIQALEHESLPQDVTLIDGGTAFPAMAGDLTDYSKLIIVDAVNGGASPGTIYRLQLDEILEGQRQTQSDRSMPGSETGAGMVSLHDLGVIEALVLERFHRDVRGQAAHDEVVIVGIEPENVALSMELSATIESRLPQLLQAVLDELTDCVCAAHNGGQRGRRYEEESS
jgi:hydrogenase maturation protease